MKRNRHSNFHFLNESISLEFGQQHVQKLLLTSFLMLHSVIISAQTTFTWNGSVDRQWNTTANWTPNTGFPSANDNVVITGSGVLKKLQISADKIVNNFELAGTDANSFTLDSGKSLTINGNIIYSGVANAVLDCNSQIKITSTSSQPVPPLTYGNLDVLGGPRVLSNSGFIRICSAFKVNTSVYTYTVSGSTVEYISSASGWLMPPFTYDNLIISGAGDYTMDGITINVQGNFLQSDGTLNLGDNLTSDATLNVAGNAILSGTANIEGAKGKNIILTIGGNFSQSEGSFLRLRAKNNTMNIGGDLLIGNGQFDTQKGPAVISVSGNFIQTGGKFFLADSNDAQLNIKKDLTISGSSIFDLNYSSAGNGVVNLEGDLSVATNALLYARTTPLATFNFNGNGDGLSSATTQTINLVPNVTKVGFVAKNKSYVKLINQNLIFGTSSQFTVEGGATLDFGFDLNDNALSIIKAVGQTLQKFELKNGGTVKITSPFGITNDGNTTDGNVLLPTRIYASGLGTNYYYTGKADQVTGDGLPTVNAVNPGPSRNVIVEMFTDVKTLKATNVQRFNSDATLEIRKGTVIDNPGDRFANSGFADEKGKLKMSGGRYILNTSNSQPDFDGNFDLSGGIVEFAGSNSKTIKSSLSTPVKLYKNIEITGTDVRNSSGNINLNSGGTFKIKNTGAASGGVFSTGNRSISCPTFDCSVQVENFGTFKVGNTKGFSGFTTTTLIDNSAINSSISNITLDNGSTVEYVRPNNQPITAFQPLNATESNLNTGGYYNLKISGDNTTISSSKTIETTTTPVYVRNNLQIDNNAFLKIEVNKALIINKNIINNGTLLIENDGNLLQKNDTGVYSGNDLTVNRDITLSSGRQQYNYLSSPILNVGLKDIYKDSADNAVVVPFVLYHNEGNNKFYNSTGAYIKGRGLAVKEPSLASFLNGSISATFRGKPGNGDFTYTLSNSGTMDTGYNLIGNPYPSNIDINTFYNLATNRSKISSTFYFWDNTVNFETQQLGSLYNGAAYALFNAVAGGTGTGVKAGSLTGSVTGTKEPTRIVKSGQGFMIRSLSTINKEIDFNNTIRSPDSGAGFYGKINNSTGDRFWLELLAPSNMTTQMAVVYFADGNDAFAEDDSEMFGNPSDAIYSNLEDKKVLINGKSAFINTDKIKLGNNMFLSGMYTIKVGNKDGLFANGQNIYLKDRQTGIVTNLSEGNCSFAANAGESSGRFEIIYKPEAILATESSAVKQITVYLESGQMVIKSPKTILEVQLFDMTGRSVYVLKPNKKKITFEIAALPSGVYFIKLQTVDGGLFSRKFIR